MSWISENYEKATLGTGIVCLLGLGLLGLSKMGSAGELSQYSEPSPRVQPLPELEYASNVASSVDKGHEIALEPVGVQTYHLFVGPSLWLRKGMDKVAALYDGAPVHPPVPNKWFMDYGMDQTLKKADALEADDDGDGFTNLEEFNSKTDPTDSSKHPPLIEKLQIAEVMEDKMYLRLVVPQQGQTGVEALKGRRVDWRFRDLKPGDKFGPKDAPERFELKKVERQTYKKGNMELEDWRADFSDSGKLGNPEWKLFRHERFLTIPDIRVRFRLLAGPNKGEEFEIEEGESFSLPPGGKAQFQLLSGSQKLGKAQVKDLSEGKTLEIK